ncbi:MAG: aminoglycoside phosphotransferase family protein [Steroidobacterales bacterium]
MTVTDARIELIRGWLEQDLHWPLARLEPASADASFRRYFRVWRRDGATRVVMDAPPDKEDIAPYLHVAALLERCGVHVPHIEAADRERGCVLLEDLGQTPYLTRLQSGIDVERLYGDALEALLRIQIEGRAAAATLAPYDRAVLERELRLMPEWFCERHLRLRLQADDRAILERSFDLLIAAALAQPQVFVHRDYHSRNLMLVAERNPGIIDFQDALHGPIGYDLVSLLKDCYIAWPRARVEGWVRGFHRQLHRRGFDTGADEAQFLRWFDLIGVQRHIKVLGIFARLWYRDGKGSYLRDLPLTLDYLRDTSARYDELAGLSHWLEQRIVPEFTAANARALGTAG